MLAELDHLAISAGRLDAAAAHVETALGIAPAGGGKHPAMGTHNRLLGLGPGLYLEAIAIDPDAPTPGRARWFDLDRFTGPPRLTNWIARCTDLEAALAAAPAGAGTPMDLARGDLRWRMAVPEDGRLPFGGCFPALIEWQAGGHPSERLDDSGCRLAQLVLTHPDAPALRAALAPLVRDDRITVEDGPVPALRAAFGTLGGRRVLV